MAVHLLRESSPATEDDHREAATNSVRESAYSAPAGILAEVLRHLGIAESAWKHPGEPVRRDEAAGPRRDKT